MFGCGSAALGTIAASLDCLFRKIFLVINDAKRYLNGSSELLMNLIGLELLLQLKASRAISGIFQAMSSTF